MGAGPGFSADRIAAGCAPWLVGGALVLLIIFLLVAAG